MRIHKVRFANFEFGTYIFGLGALASAERGVPGSRKAVVVLVVLVESLETSGIECIFFVIDVVVVIFEVSPGVVIFFQVSSFRKSFHVIDNFKIIDFVFLGGKTFVSGLKEVEKVESFSVFGSPGIFCVYASPF